MDNWWEGETGRQEIAALIRYLNSERGTFGMQSVEDAIDDVAGILEKPWKWTEERNAMVAGRKVST